MNTVVNRTQLAVRVTLVGSVIDALLGAMKIIVGYVAHSHALVVDGVHSLSDLLTDLGVVLVSRYSGEDPDESHPYGHGRFETFGTVVLGSFLVFVALALFYDNAQRLWNKDELLVPTWPALCVAFISIVSKEWVFRYTKKIGEEINSKLIIANAWHSRTDMFSSIVVLVGVAGAMMGWLWLDLVAALAVALLIIKIGVDLAYPSVKELVDTALSPEEIEKIRHSILEVSGVVDVHSLRSRRLGPHAYLDVHIQVAPDISVSEGHQIAHWASRKVIREFEDIEDVTFHIDAENDDLKDKEMGTLDLLPLRSEVLKILESHWHNIPYIEKRNQTILHYLDNKVAVEVFMPIALLSQSEFDRNQFELALNQGTENQTWVAEIKVWYG